MCVQSLEAALAHHNLGSFEESLKYLETARIQLIETEREKVLVRKRNDMTRQMLKEAPVDAKGELLEPIILPEIVVLEAEVVVPYDCRFYVIACKGNVYQSCGDDEQSLLQYMKGWEIASVEMHKDWEILFINSVGLLAYYNLHYDLAWRCFSRVTTFREMVSSQKFFTCIGKPMSTTDICVCTTELNRNMATGVQIRQRPGTTKDAACSAWAAKEQPGWCLSVLGMCLWNPWEVDILAQWWRPRIATRQKGVRRFCTVRVSRLTYQCARTPTAC